MTDIVEKIDCYVRGEIWDEAVMWRTGNKYYIQYIGLGVTKKISKKQYEIIKENGYC